MQLFTQLQLKQTVSKTNYFQAVTVSILLISIWITVSVSQPVNAIVSDFTRISRVNDTRFAREMTVRSDERFVQVVHALNTPDAHLHQCTT